MWYSALTGVKMLKTPGIPGVSFNESGTLKNVFGCLGLRCGADLHSIVWDMCCGAWARQVGPLTVAHVLSCLRAYGIWVP